MRRFPPLLRTLVLVFAAVLLALGTTSGADAARRPKTGGTLTGTLVAPDGLTPAAGVNVRAFRVDPPSDPQMACANVTLAASTVTGTDGTYRLTPLPADDDYRIQFLPADPATAISWYDDDPMAVTVLHGEPVPVADGDVANLGTSTLFAAGTLTGSVVEGGSGAPLAGMAVTLMHQGACQIWPVTDPQVAATPVLTDATGAFSFTQVPPTVSASDPGDQPVPPGGYTPGDEYDSVDLYSWVGDPSGWHVDYSAVDAPWATLDEGATVARDPFVLSPSGKVTGVVKDARGRGIPGIQLIALHSQSAPWTPTGLQWYEADYAQKLTDAKGRFTFTVTPRIALRLEARDSRLDNRDATGAWAREYWPAAPVPQLGASIVVDPLTTFVLPTAFVLEPGASMSGTVTGFADPQQPLGGFHAWTHALVGGTWYPLTYSYVYDHDGWFGFFGLPAGTYRVVFETQVDDDPVTYTEEWRDQLPGQGDPITLAAGEHRFGIDAWLDPVIIKAVWNGPPLANTRIVSAGGQTMPANQAPFGEQTVFYAALPSTLGPYHVEVDWPGVDGHPPWTQWFWLPQPQAAPNTYTVTIG
jgi:hypothetical protein